ncbi:MAG: BlaI/MecI/CopY family transcriptional regulator [Vicinamibacterales bacterium]
MGKASTPHPGHLSRREREIVNAVFALDNRASAEDIRARLVNPPSASSVRVMISRLEKKGHLKHTQDGARFLYSATVSPISAKKSALRQYVETFFEGSLAQMVTALVRQESWTADELKALRAEIDRVHKEKKR